MTSTSVHPSCIDGKLIGHTQHRLVYFNSIPSSLLPSFLPSSDTPHHLKNKRVQHLTDKQANEILANALATQERNEPTSQLAKVQSPIEENADAEQLEQEQQQQQHPFDASLSPIPAEAAATAAAAAPPAGKL